MRKQKLSGAIERTIVTMRAQGIDAKQIAVRLDLAEGIVRSVLEKRLPPDDPPEELQIEQHDGRRRRLRTSSREENQHGK